MRTTLKDLIAPKGYSCFFGRVRSVSNHRHSDEMLEIVIGLEEGRTYMVSNQDPGVNKIKVGRKCLILFDSDGHGLYVIVAIFRRAPIVLLRTMHVLQESQMLSRNMIQAFGPSYLYFD